MRKLSSKINLHAKSYEPLSDYIANELLFLKQHGFDAADFSLNLLKPLGENWRSCVETAIEDSKKIGLPFEVCHLPYSTSICTNPDLLPSFEEQMHRAIDAAALLGADYAVLHPNTTTEPAETFCRNKQYDSVMHHLEPFAEHAQRVGVKLAVENMRVVHNTYPTHRYCQDPDELCEIADALSVAVCWDFGHGHIGGIKQSDALHYIGSRLKAVHINDNTARDDDHIPPFCGTVDWKDAMQALNDIGYAGLFNYEIAAQRVPNELRDSFASYLVQAAKTLQSF